MSRRVGAQSIIRPLLMACHLRLEGSNQGYWWSGCTNGFEFCSSLILFFRLSFRNCLSCVNNATVFLLFNLPPAVHSVFHIFIFIFFFLHGYVTNSQYDQLPVGSIGELVEHYTGIAELMCSNPERLQNMTTFKTMDSLLNKLWYYFNEE